MKQTLSIIASAWSTAFIGLFLVYAAAKTPLDPAVAEARARAIIVLFVAAVTGTGWLWHRHALKRNGLEAVEEGL